MVGPGEESLSVSIKESVLDENEDCGDGPLE